MSIWTLYSYKKKNEKILHVVWFSDILVSMKGLVIKGKGSKHVDKFRKREITCYKMIEIQYFSRDTKSTVQTHSISQAIRPALGASRYWANAYPASSRDTHMGAFFVFSLCLKGPAWKLRNWRGTRLDLINERGKEITNSNSLLDYRFHLSSLPSSLNSRF